MKNSDKKKLKDNFNDKKLVYSHRSLFGDQITYFYFGAIYVLDEPLFSFELIWFKSSNNVAVVSATT